MNPPTLKIRWLAANLLVFSLVRAFGANYYLDVNGSSEGSGVVNSGAYLASGTYWSTDGAGTTTPGTVSNYARGSTLYFSAGADATGLNYSLSSFSSLQPSGVTVSEGYVTLDKGSGFSSPTLTTAQGTSLTITGAWDFYGNVNTFNTTGSSLITLSSVPNVSNRGAWLRKAGDGLMLINAAASAHGITVEVNGGELRLLNGSSLFTSGYAASITVNSGGTLELSSGITLSNTTLTLNGNGYASLGALNNFSSSNSVTGLINLASDSRIQAAAGTILTLSPFAGDAVTGAFGLALGGSGMIIVAKPISAVTALTKDGSGIATLTAINPFTGPTWISSGTLRLVETSGTLASVGGPIQIDGNLEITHTASQIFSNLVTGGSTGNLQKLGSGILTLTATSSYAGAITVNAGCLALSASATLDNSTPIAIASGAFLDVSAIPGFSLKSGQTLAGLGTVSGTLTAVSGAQLSPGVSGTLGALVFSQSLNMTGGVTTLLDLATTPAGTGDSLTIGGNFTFTGTNSIRVNYTTLANGVYPLIRTTGTINGNLNTMQLLGFIPSTQIASLQISGSGKELDLVVSTNAYAGRTLTWSGTANLWDAGNTSSWLTGSSTVQFTTNDQVIFDGNGAARPSVVLSGLLAPGSVTVSAANDYTFSGSGSIIGTAPLVKSGLGRLTITNSNNFTGGTTLNGGILEIQSNSALGSGSVSNTATLSFRPATTLTFGNLITGSGTLNQLSGTSTLTGSNHITGPINVTGGTLQVGHIFGLGTGAGTITVGSAGTLDLNGLALGAESVLLQGGTLANCSTTGATLGGSVMIAANSTLTGGDLNLAATLSGTANLTKTGTGTLILTGSGSRTGTLEIGNGSLILNGTAGTGPILIDANALLGGTGTISGPVTVSGTLVLSGGLGNHLTLNQQLTLQPGSSTVAGLVKSGASVSAVPAITGLTGVTLGGTLVVSQRGSPVLEGDVFPIFQAAQCSGSFTGVQLPYLYGNLIWDSSSLNTNGILRVIKLPDVSTSDQRRAWIFTRAIENPSGIDASVMAGAYFTRGDIAQGQACALAMSRSLVTENLSQAEVNLFDIWPAMDLYLRFGNYLDTETKANIQNVVTTFTQYSITNTANLKTLAMVTRYLGSQAFGESAFIPGSQWSTNDPSAHDSLLLQFTKCATTGFGEHASRPYYWKNALPLLSVGQLSADPVMRQEATMAYESALAQNAATWMRGHLGVSTSRSYPDELSQLPITSLGMLWFHFGGEIAPTYSEAATMTAIMNQAVSPILQTAAQDRSAAFTTRQYISGVHQTSFLDGDYVFFSDGPKMYGNFQVYANGVVWCEPDLTRFSFLWVAKPFLDDQSKMNVSNPHGRNTGYYKEGQSQDAVAYIYDIPATGDTYPYALGYVPGGYRALVNEAASSGRIFLHYGTVMIAISSENLFTWDPSAGVNAYSTAPAAGDSDFRIYGTQFGVGIETARPAAYPGATAAEQLAAFRADILANTALSHTSGAPPVVHYTSRRGNTIDVKRSADPTIQPISVNSQPYNYNIWPMLENPWMRQLGDGVLTLMTPTRRDVYDFNQWTRSTQLAPTFSAPASPTPAVAGQSVDINLGTLAQPGQISDPALKFTLSNPSQGTVCMLSDGHTARFTPNSGSSGAASFALTAHAAGIDPGRLVFSYTYLPAENLAGHVIADRSGHSLNSAINPTTGATFSLVNDVPPVLATSNTTSLELDEASTKAVRLTGTVALTQHDLSDASWTFTTWVKRLSRTSNDFVLYLGSGDGFGGNGDELQLYFPANTDTIELRHYNASNALDLDLVSGSTATSNAWHQVALTFNRSGLKSGTATLYLDGTSVGASPVTWSLDQGDPLVIGGHNITTGTALASWLNGRLSETALFNTALSANDISVLNNLSVAQFTGLNVSGSMTLWVVTPQQSWRQNAFGNSANAGLGADGADPDHDGVPNLVEYALGSNPLSGASFALPTPGRSGNYLTLTFTRARSDVTYGVEASADLVNWITLALNPGTVGQSITVYDTVDITTAPAHRRFMRLRITN